MKPILATACAAMGLLTGCAAIPTEGESNGIMSRREAACHIMELESGNRSTSARLWILKTAQEASIAGLRKKWEILPGEAAIICRDFLMERRQSDATDSQPRKR